MKTKIVDKSYRKTLALGLLLSILGSRPSVAAVTIDGGLTTQSFNDLAWNAFEWIEVAILTPLTLAWVLACALRQIQKKKGLDSSGSKDFFQSLTVGLIFAILSYVSLFIVLTYFTSFKDSDYYKAVVLFVIFISDFVIYLWIFLHFVRYIIGVRKNKKLLIKIDNNQNDANKTI